jgi:hypothetical protein
VNLAALTFLSGSAALLPLAGEDPAYEPSPASNEQETPAAEPEGAVLDSSKVPAFVLAGNATFTLVSKTTGARFTFRVRASKDEDDSRFFVSVLTGPDNGTDYQFLGTVFDRKRFAHGRKSRISPDAPSALAFRWFWAALSNRGVAPATCEVWHLGSCGKCGRALTVPESISSGLGPICAGRS